MATEAADGVLLRGLAREHRHWGAFPACLKANLHARTVLLPDLPGRGRRHRETYPVDMRDLTASVRAEVMTQRRSGPLYLLGLSLGAMVALEWVSRYPAECAGAVVMNTSLARVSPFYHRLQPQIYWRFLSGVMPGGNLRRREATILDLISNRAADRAKTLEEWVAYARDTPVSGSNVLRQLVAAMRYLGPRERPAVPLLVLSGMGDRLVSPLCSARIAGRWSLPLRSHPTAGHDLTLDAADWVCEQVGLWLQGTDTSPGGSDLAAR